MIKLFYSVKIEDTDSEVKWLREQKIFPSHEEHYDWLNHKKFTKIGVIVSEEQALAIKLRHKVDLQQEYKQR